MVISIQEAYNILDLRKGASPDEVVNNYKRLALEWHPDKHNQSELSFEKFSKINNAFRRLTAADDKEITKPLAKEKMFQIFEDVYTKKKSFSATKNNVSISSEDGKKQQKDIIVSSQLSKEKNKMPTLPPKAVEVTVDSSDEDVETKEENLAAEQEEKRKNAEKRRAKKKRRKEAKKLEKELLISQENKTSVPASVSNVTSCRSSRSSSVDTDSSEKVNSSQKVVDTSKQKSKGTPNTITSKNNPSTEISSKKNSGSIISKNVKEAAEVKVETPIVDPLILQSRRLATRGNELASDENFIAAVELYSEAIKINSDDFRFYGNRSYCYDKLGLFNKALADAEQAIKLNPEWSKNYHRKGRALAGLKKYVEAEALFEAVLKMDKDCAEAKQELYTVRLQQLMEMGFTKLQAETAILQYKSVSAALDSLLQAPVARAGAGAMSSSDVYVSDDENQTTTSRVQKTQLQQIQQLQQLKLQHKPLIDIKMDPSNPEGLNSLWVGNISKDVEESALRRLFSPFGAVISVKKKPDTYYAFVEFADKASAGMAMRALQGVLFGSQNLYIRFPGKTGQNAQPSNNPLVLKKAVSISPTYSASSWSTGNPPPPTKLKGPVNGNECYFWRTTGCSYGDNCKFKHVPSNKGVDRKPWQTATA